MQERVLGHGSYHDAELIATTNPAKVDSCRSAVLAVAKDEGRRRATICNEATRREEREGPPRVARLDPRRPRGMCAPPLSRRCPPSRRVKRCGKRAWRELARRATTAVKRSLEAPGQRGRMRPDRGSKKSGLSRLADRTADLELADHVPHGEKIVNRSDYGDRIWNKIKGNQHVGCAGEYLRPCPNFLHDRSLLMIPWSLVHKVIRT